MRAKKYEGMDGHAVKTLGLADDAEDDVRQLGRRLEQQPSGHHLGGWRSGF